MRRLPSLPLVGDDSREELRSITGDAVGRGRGAEGMTIVIGAGVGGFTSIDALEREGSSSEVHCVAYVVRREVGAEGRIWEGVIVGEDDATEVSISCTGDAGLVPAGVGGSVLSRMVI